LLRFQQKLIIGANYKILSKYSQKEMSKVMYNLALKAKKI